MASILDIIMRRMIGTVVNWGTRRGIDAIANRSKPTGPAASPSKTAKQRQREAAKRARQAARITRIGRR